MSSADIDEMANVSGAFTVQRHNQIERARIDALLFARDLFIKEGIQKIIADTAKQLKSDLERDAPFDTVPYDDYHMQDHMTDKPIENGRAVESEAAYSGHLEYGTAYHGVQHVFFQPATWKNWKIYKENVIRAMKGIFTI